jgi:hypothetical protein
MSSDSIIAGEKVRHGDRAAQRERQQLSEQAAAELGVDPQVDVDMLRGFAQIAAEPMLRPVRDQIMDVIAWAGQGRSCSLVLTVTPGARRKSRIEATSINLPVDHQSIILARLQLSVLAEPEL